MKARRSDWEKNPPVGPVSFRQGWEDVRDAYDGTDFACFMSGVLRDDSNRPDLEALMKDFGPRWRLRSPIARGA